MTILRPSIFSEHGGIVAAVSTRQGGVSGPVLGLNLSYNVGDDRANVDRNREIFFGELGIEAGRLAIPRQVHGDRVLAVDSPGIYDECDALLTRTPQVFLCVTIADCVPILLHDPTSGTIAAVHAGWRGSAANILSGAIRKMKDDLGASVQSMRAYLGPAAGECCYTVGDEVAARFESECVRREDAHLLVDLKGANVRQLTRAGLDPSNIEVSAHCTISEDSLFHSHRRDGVRSGRMMAVIGLLR